MFTMDRKTLVLFLWVVILSSTIHAPEGYTSLGNGRKKRNGILTEVIELTS